MNLYMLLITAFLVPAFATAAGVATPRAKALLSQTVMQDGPNCFNTSLYLQGFTQDLTYTSQTELDFYLQNFCSKNAAGAPLKSRDLVTFVNPEDRSQIAHSLVSLNGNQILEKSSLLGALNPAQEEDPQPGQFLKQDISASLYSAPASENIFGSIFKQNSFHCQPEGQVTQALAKAGKNRAIQEQLLFRKELAQAVMISNRQELETKILNSLVPIMTAMTWNKQTPTSKLETQYLHALLRSNAYQMHLLNCSESVRKFGECHVPHLKKSTEQTDAWYGQIYAFEKKHHLK